MFTKNRKFILFLVLSTTLFISDFKTTRVGADQNLLFVLGLNPTPQPAYISLEQGRLNTNPQTNFQLENSQSNPVVRGVVGDQWADVIIGQPGFHQITPNEVVGNKLFNPGGVYLDRSTIPNRSYVYDAGNSRILGFSSLGTCTAGTEIGQSCTSDSDCPDSACSIQNNKPADIIIGQPNPNTSTCNGDSGFQSYPDLPVPSASTLCGLRPEQNSILEGGSVVTMSTDSQGNLYHPDYFNNRVLRYNNPFMDDSIADYVWGQPDLSYGSCNQGRSFGNPDDHSLCLAAPLGDGSLKTGVTTDLQLNLWVTDTQNNRVVRFPYNPTLGAPAPAADLVLGQVNFSTAIAGNGANQMNKPASIRVDSSGNVYVLDGIDGWGTNGRLLVFHPPFSNGMSASQIFDGLGHPTGLELDSNGELWINNSYQNEMLHLKDGQLLSNQIFSGNHGGIGIDRDGNFMLTGWDSQEVLVFSGSDYSWISTYLQADEYGSFNQLGAHGVTDPAGLEVTNDQLIVSDRSRLLFWNNPSQLANNYPPADGVVGQPDFTTRPRWDPTFGRMRADAQGRLWVTVSPAQIVAYQLPLTTGATPIITLSSPMPLLGGGSFEWGNTMVLSGLAYEPSCDCLWVSDTEYNRVFRIRNVGSPQRVVDIVLGQKRDPGTLEIGTHCNQGRDSDDGYIHPSFPSQDSLCHPGGLALDRYGNLFVSDHNLEVAGNWRLLEYDAANLPTSPGTALFAIPASRVYGRGGSFTEPNCINNDPLCGPWEAAFDSSDQMIIGFNSYLGPTFPQIYQDPMTNPLPSAALMDFYSHAYSIRFDPQGRMYVLDLVRNRVMIYWSIETPISTPLPLYTPTSAPTDTPTTTPTRTPTRTPTVTRTVTMTPTRTSTQTPSQTPTNTATSTLPTIPTNTSVSTITIGETNVLSTSYSGMGNQLAAQKVTLSQSATIQSLSYYVSTPGGQLRLGIYNNAGGSPGTLMAETAAFTPVAGWNTQPVITTTLLPAGTYWLAFLPQNNTLTGRVTFSGTGRYYNYVFGTMPSTFSSSSTTGAFHFSFYATFSLGTAPTNTPTLTPTRTSTPTSTSSATSTSTSTITPTRTSTPTNSPTRTPTSTTPSGSTITLGETSVLTTPYSGMGNQLVAQRVTLSQSATIQSLSYYVSTTGGQLRLGIYTNSVNAPGTLVADTAAFTPAAGWNTQPVLTPTTLPAGTYWLVFLPQNNTLAGRLAVSGTGRYSAYSFGAMPTAFPSSSMADTFRFSLYATLTIP